MYSSAARFFGGLIVIPVLEEEIFNENWLQAGGVGHFQHVGIINFESTSGRIVRGVNVKLLGVLLKHLDISGFVSHRVDV